MADGTDTFYGSIPVFRGFASLMDPAPVEVRARVPAKHDGTVAQTGTVSSVDEEKPIAIKRTRYPLCQTVPSLDTVYGAQAVCVSANLLLIPAKFNYRKAAIAERGRLMGISRPVLMPFSRP
jgi:hypothetical protein